MLYKKPKVDAVCDSCGDTLVIRADDEPATIKDRLDVYHTQTEPLINYYEKQGKLFVVVGQEEISDTTALVQKVLED